MVTVSPQVRVVALGCTADLFKSPDAQNYLSTHPDFLQILVQCMRVCSTSLPWLQHGFCILLQIVHWVFCSRFWAGCAAMCSASIQDICFTGWCQLLIASSVHISFFVNTYSTVAALSCNLCQRAWQLLQAAHHCSCPVLAVLSFKQYWSSSIC